MQLTGEHTFDAPREVVWKFLMDPAVLEACLPGAENMTEVGPDEYTATMKVGIAMIKGTFTGKVALVARTCSQRITATRKGGWSFTAACHGWIALHYG